MDVFGPLVRSQPKKMKITVICEPCSANTNEPAAECVEMTIIGPLVFNPETKSQSQLYECRECLGRVTLIIQMEK